MVGLIKNYVAFGSMAVPALTFAMMAVMPVAMAMPALVERDDHDVNRRVMPLQTILIEDATVSDTRNHRVLVSLPYHCLKLKTTTLSSLDFDECPPHSYILVICHTFLFSVFATRMVPMLQTKISQKLSSLLVVL